ncbi:hypothetical protein N2603_40330 [Bradyrhizobium huanghuaihaiense]|uniref:hypothetical protein n=1 Tax=Bradyrhizobium huanghuaihaiense TaxID=990078 RepID=UPI0021A9A018|nr:hypothetical protein [Bradyrhizobium sp. CB3035]UWU76098.1 hypothetical protein N2603_40330 [Bradyrhizobium sp. CB3035]
MVDKSDEAGSRTCLPNTSKCRTNCRGGVLTGARTPTGRKTEPARTILAKGYATETPFYDALGNNTFHHWLREVIADEAVHSMNAVNAIRARYRDRIGQVGTILDNLIRAADNLRY